MITQSIILGIIFGLVWGIPFINRIKQAVPTHFLASTSTIRYLLLAVLLGLLVTNKIILLSWWLAGFLGAFWGLTIWSTMQGARKNL
ncbi:hypothetical protein KAT92_03870 [Candidatus Babeliales bacterium]|nr:hypothetical protein [Candidatus Babeliales bacterium]